LIVLVDTSAIIAISDRRHILYNQFNKLMQSGDNVYIVPVAVATEACYILNNRFGPRFEINLIKEIIETNFILEPVAFEDLSRILELLIKYEDLNLGFADGSIVAIAERLKTNKILTLDRKHFDVVIPKGFDYFDILI
jgi:uncharacterized protein